MSKVVWIVLAVSVLAIISTILIVKRVRTKVTVKTTGTVVDDLGNVIPVTVVTNNTGNEVGINDITGEIVDLGTYIPTILYGGSTGDYCVNALGEEGQIATNSANEKYCKVLKHVSSYNG